MTINEMIDTYKILLHVDGDKIQIPTAIGKKISKSNMRARGVHGIDPMIDIVGKLLRDGWTDEDVSKELGMDADEVLRFKQHVGLPELFKDYEYSKAWE